jgi:cell division protein FtsB
VSAIDVLDTMFAELAKARAENARLVTRAMTAEAEMEDMRSRCNHYRAALAEIADAPFAAVGLSRAADHNQLIDIARKALER